VKEDDFMKSAKADLVTGQAGTIPAEVATDLAAILSHVSRYEGDLERARDAIRNADTYQEAKSKINALKISKA
jgi:hypothetical protein